MRRHLRMVAMVVLVSVAACGDGEIGADGATSTSSGTAAAGAAGATGGAPTGAGGMAAGSTGPGSTGAGSGGTGGGAGGGGIPGPDNTGVPAGTMLTTHDGDLHVTTAGAVIDALDIRGCVFIEAPDVTITRSKISECTGVHTTVVRNNGNPVVLEDVEIDGGMDDANVDLAGVGHEHVTCRRCNLHGLTKGAHVGGANYVIEYSWIHDLYMPGEESQSPHGEGIYDNATQHGVIRGNNIDSTNHAGTPNNSGALAIYNSGGDHDDLLVENNLFNTDDAAICMYVGYTHNGTSKLTNVRVLNNRFGHQYYVNCGSWQPVWSAGGHQPMNWGSDNGNEWSGNTFTDGPVVDPPY